MAKAKGSAKTGGRKAGTPNKVTAALKDAILEALDVAKGLPVEGQSEAPTGAVAYLQRQSEENPVAFMTLIGKVLPLQLAGDGDGGPMTLIIKRVTDSGN